MSHATPARRDVPVPARPAAQRSPEAIQAEMESTRNRLADTIDQLVFRANPKTIAQRHIDEIRARFVDVNGNPRTDEIARIGSAALGALAVLVVIRKLVNR